MPEIVQEIPNLPTLWDQVLDGKKWKLVRDVDYDCDERVMVDRAKSAARRRKLKVVVRYSRRLGEVYVESKGSTDNPLESPPSV